MLHKADRTDLVVVSKLLSSSALPASYLSHHITARPPLLLVQRFPTSMANMNWFVVRSEGPTQILSGSSDKSVAWPVSIQVQKLLHCWQLVLFAFQQTNTRHPGLF